MSTEELVSLIYKSRKTRVTDPMGYFTVWGVWYPTSWEAMPCCFDLKTKPNKKFKYVYIKHCRTKKHVRHLVEKYGTDNPVLRGEYRRYMKHVLNLDQDGRI